MTLNELRAGQCARVSFIGGGGVARRRLLDMGITPDTVIMMRRSAPLGDPIQIRVRGYELALGRMMAETIVISLIF